MYFNWQNHHSNFRSISNCPISIENLPDKVLFFCFVHICIYVILYIYAYTYRSTSNCPIPVENHSDKVSSQIFTRWSSFSSILEYSLFYRALFQKRPIFLHVPLTEDIRLQMFGSRDSLSFLKTELCWADLKTVGIAGIQICTADFGVEYLKICLKQHPGKPG